MLLRHASCYWTILTYVAVHLSLSKSQLVTQAECFGNITLPCSSTQNADDYRFVAWYKVNITAQTLTGIIRKAQNSAPRKYNYSREASFGKRGALFLPGVRPEDSGMYLCKLGAHVGGQNKEERHNLNVTECQTPAVPTPANITGPSTSSFPVGHSDIPSMWLAAGFSVVGFVKALLCFLVVWSKSRKAKVAKAKCSVKMSRRCKERKEQWC